jgi:phosphomannomutase
LDWSVIRRENLDGIKVYLAPDGEPHQNPNGEPSKEVGWLMVRASGTEPMLRIYSETTSPETTQQILTSVSTLVHSF